MNNSDIYYSALPDDALAGLSNEGDEQAFNELVFRYLGTISFIARKYYARGYDESDFTQEGLMGLLHACRTYSSNRGISFKSYVCVVVERRFISILRSSTAKKKVPDSALVQIEALSDDVEDVTGSPEERLLLKEQLLLVKQRLKGILSKREYEVLMLYAGGLSYGTISLKLGISEKSVDNALQRVRRKVGAFYKS